MKQKKRTDRKHDISVKMKPDILHIENMGHLAKEDEPEKIDTTIHSPDLSKCFKRVTIGKTIYFPRNKEQYEKLLTRLT